MNPAAVDFYARLGVSVQATPDEIRRAYRSLARTYHPDVAHHKSHSKAHAEEMFKRLHEAYSTLADNALRRQYDAGRLARSAPKPRRRPAPEPEPEPPPSPAPKGRGKKAPSPAKTVHRRDLDIESALEIGLGDAIHGAVYVLTLQQQDTATRRPTIQSCQVEIPAGVYEGQRLRLRGLGHLDRYRSAAGDLYLTIRYAREDDFRFIGSHLLSELELAPWEAALGARVRIPTLDGMADFHVPPGTQPGERLRLEGYGLPQPDGERGDLCVTVKLRVPTVVGDEERKLWMALASRHRK